VTGEVNDASTAVAISYQTLAAPRLPDAQRREMRSCQSLLMESANGQENLRKILKLLLFPSPSAFVPATSPRLRSMGFRG
jgi:hypothetical protein